MLQVNQEKLQQEYADMLKLREDTLAEQKQLKSTIEQLNQKREKMMQQIKEQNEAMSELYGADLQVKSLSIELEDTKNVLSEIKKD